jgi:hypothetical protein
MKHAIIFILLVMIASTAYAVQMTLTGVSTLNPNPVGYQTTNSVNNVIQSVSFPGGSSITSVTVSINCAAKNPNPTATVMLYSSTGATLASGSANLHAGNCAMGTTASGSVSLTSTPVTSVAKIGVTVT